MTGLEFLFLGGFLALPLALLPVLLHMLFRRKSPVIYFSTLRFIKSSIQQTAARRRIQKWLLLAVRMLLLALLILAITQPVRTIATGWTDTGQSHVAAIVVDTSYSMQLKQQELTLLNRADDIVGELLREPLRDARVAIFRSMPPAADAPEILQSASKILSEWTPLKPQPASVPMAQRVAAAVGFLSRQQANQKWLIIISDLQGREFPTPLPQTEDARTILFDLHPERPKSYGITSVQAKPEQPMANQLVADVTGFAGDARAVTFKINKLDGTTLNIIGPLMASFDSTGRSTVRAPLTGGLPAEPYLLLEASTPEDDLAWDNTRVQLLERPPRLAVSFVENSALPAASRLIRLGLDPSEGANTGWPLQVSRAADLAGGEHAVVLPLSDWPDESRAVRLRDFAKSGGTVVLLLQPGIEQSYDKLAKPVKDVLAELLPAPLAPVLAGGASAGSGLFRPAAPARPDPILEDALDTLRQPPTVRRFVPFVQPSDPAVTTLLHLSPASADSRTASFGLYYRRQVGNGLVFTFSTLPEGRYMTPPAHPAFVIQLAKSCFKLGGKRDAANVELGRPLTLAGPRFVAFSELEIESPSKERYRVRPAGPADAQQFTFERTIEPGLYTWRNPADGSTLALSNVQYPSEESHLLYRPADAVVTPSANCLVVRSFADLKNNVAKLNEPEPRWSWLVALVLVLLCAEALLGSLAHLWKGWSWKSLLSPAVSAQ